MRDDKKFDIKFYIMYMLRGKCCEINEVNGDGLEAVCWLRVRRLPSARMKVKYCGECLDLI